MNTNYYTSIHTDISYEREVKTWGNPVDDSENVSDTIDCAIEKVNEKNRALAILLGEKNTVRTRRLDQYLSRSYSPYVTYEHLKPIKMVTTKTEIKIVDNSGPCTPNSDVDATIDVDAYINAARAKNYDNIKNAGDEFTFYSLQDYESVGDAYFNALQEKYAILHRETMQHADPELYIKDKYKNPDSPFYASELSWVERSIAYRYERQMLKLGKIDGIHFQDSLFRGKPVKVTQVDGDERRYRRKVMNQELSNILQNHGITVPEGVNLRCTVNPTTCYISIEDVTGDGSDRKGLCESIEKAINVKENGINLYRHIMHSCYSTYNVGSTQYSYEGRIKFEYLHNTEGISYGMHGDYNAKFIFYCERHHSTYADKAKEVGFDGFKDMYLSIDITSNGFEDAYQDVNWCDDEDKSIVEWVNESAYSTL